MQIPVGYESLFWEIMYWLSLCSVSIESLLFSVFCAINAKLCNENKAVASSCSQFPLTVFPEVKLLIRSVLNELWKCSGVGLIVQPPWLLIIPKKFSSGSRFIFQGEKLLNPICCRSRHKRWNPFIVNLKFFSDGTVLTFLVSLSTKRILFAIHWLACFQKVEWQLLPVTSLRRAFFVDFISSFLPLSPVSHVHGTAPYSRQKMWRSYRNLPSMRRRQVWKVSIWSLFLLPYKRRRAVNVWNRA